MGKAANAKREQLRALGRLVAQSRLNEAQTASLGRSGEAAAWADVAEFLEDVLRAARAGGITYVDRPLPTLS